VALLLASAACSARWPETGAGRDADREPGCPAAGVHLRTLPTV